MLTSTARPGSEDLGHSRRIIMEHHIPSTRVGCMIRSHSPGSNQNSETVGARGYVYSPDGEWFAYATNAK